MPEENSVPDAAKPEVYSRKDHTVSRTNIDPDALKILYRLGRAGFKAYLVGGGVRDLLLDKRPKDFDIATDASSREIKSLFRNSRIIGKRYKLVHIFFHGGKNIEVSTFRDVGVPVDPNTVAEANAPIITRENTFGTEETDARRRDLTINALFYDVSSFSIIDYVGGVKDLRASVIRIIGEPDVRFAEDPVRMIRVARHAARNNFTIEERTKASVIKNFHLIARASPVRVYDELKKDLSFGYSLNTFRLLAELRLLEPLFPEIIQRDGVLLSDVSEFSRCLNRVDTVIREGGEVSTATVLALMLLFIQGLTSHRRDIYTWFQDSKEIAEGAKTGFKYLSVPKKERERISGVLSLWHELGPPPFSRDRIVALRRTNGRDDLAMLVQILSGEDDASMIRRYLPVTTDERRGGGRTGPMPREFPRRDFGRKRRPQ